MTSNIIAELIEKFDASWEERHEAVRSLIELRDPQAVEPLIRVLSVEDWGAPDTAAEVLGELGDSRAVEPLIAALESRNGYLSTTTLVEALAKLGDPRGVEPALAGLLADEDDWLNHSAPITQTLQQFGGPRFDAWLITCLAHDHWWIRRLAAETLGELGAVEATEPLLKALADDTLWVRAAVLQVLGQIGDARAIGSLIIRLQDENSGLRRIAAHALQEIGRRQGVEPFITGLLAHANAEEFMVNHLDDADAQTRPIASTTLSYLRQNLWSFNPIEAGPVPLGSPLEKPLILHVDDDHETRVLTRLILERKGFRVESVPDGLTGIERAVEAQPDLIVLDIMMPGIDGYETCRRLQEVVSMPIIFCSARTDSTEGLKLGAADYVVKPVYVKDMLRRCRWVLGMSGHPEQLDLVFSGEQRPVSGDKLSSPTTS